MSQSFEEALSSLTSTCDSRLDRLKKIKVLLDATEEALFNAAAGGDLKSYKVDTGQTVITVEAQNVTSLTKRWRDLSALYNEMCGILTGSNVMVIRDGNTQRR